jgi:hypothetical protein
VDRSVAFPHPRSSSGSLVRGTLVRAIRARATPARALTGMIALSVLFRSAAGFARVTPTYFPDEYLYSSLGRSIAESGRPLVRGGSAHFTALLEPFLTAPLWLIHDTNVAYHAVQVLSVTAMSLVAVPVYLVCVALGLRRSTGLLVAAATLCAPAFMYATWLVSEPFAYPLAAGAIAAATVAIGRGSRRAQVLFLILAAAAALARIQLLVLPMAYVVATVIVGLRTRSVRRVLREQAVVAAALTLPLLLVLAMRGRLLGVYAHFGQVHTGGIGGIAQRLAANCLILLYGTGWIIVPGALIGIAAALARPRTRTELAYGAVAVTFGVGVLVQASIWGDLDRPQERYFLYAVPLLAPFFALTVERAWPWARAHALLAAAMIVLAATIPLSGYATSVLKTQSPSLFGVFRIEELLGTGSGSLVVSAAASVLALVALALPRLRQASALTVGIGLACAASLVLGIAATNFDINDAKGVRDWAFTNDVSWVDHAHVGPATLVRADASWGDVHLQMFWNRSIKSVALVPGALPVDAYPHGHLTFTDDGTLILNGRKLTGPIVADEWSTPMTFRGARHVASSTFDELLVPQKHAQLELYALGFYRDGLLKQSGSIHLWPAHAGGPVQGRLSFRLRAATWLPQTVTVQTTRSDGLQTAIQVAPGTSRNVVLTVCTTGRWDFGFLADHATKLEHRSVSLGTTAPVWRPDASACPRQ